MTRKNTDIIAELNRLTISISEVALLRLDCHLPLPQQAGFLAALDVLFASTTSCPPRRT